MMTRSSPLLKQLSSMLDASALAYSAAAWLWATRKRLAPVLTQLVQRSTARRTSFVNTVNARSRCKTMAAFLAAAVTPEAA